MTTKIELKSLHLKNFQSFKDRKFDFDGDTNISGENGTGKTTIKRALNWLLFGKDENDRTDSGRGCFTVKTLDADGNILHGLEHVVECEFFVNSKLKTLKRMFLEKWTKARGQSETLMTGHETKFWVDGVPVLAGKYQEEINSLIEETLFKLITDPFCFSVTLSKEKRRSLLEDMSGKITIEEVVSAEPKLTKIIELLSDISFEDFKKKIAEDKKGYNNELKLIPARIDENNNSIVEADFNIFKIELESKEVELSEIEDQLTDATKENPELAEKKNELDSLRTKISKIETDVTEQRYNESKRLSSALRKHQSDKTEKENLLTETKNQISRLISKKDLLAKDVEKCREDWDNQKSEEFSIDEDFTCPTCKRKLDADVIDTKKAKLQENFNQAKARALEEITAKGKSVNQQKISTETQLKQLEEQTAETETALLNITVLINDAQKAITEFESTDADYSDEYWTLRSQVDEVKKILSTPQDSSINVSDLRLRKSELIKEIDSIKSELSKEENNVKLRSRIKELEAREKELAQKIADLENNEFLCEKFIRTKVELLDQKINSMFNFVRFKLFDEQINGGLVETCEALINGVPFSDANNAAKINAGIDIINALSKHYNVSAPIFIDNRESINEIIQTDAQVINLIVSKDKNLVVKTAEQKLQVA